VKANFTPGHRVHYNIPGGADAYIVKYAGEGFYVVKHVEGQRDWMAHEDDLADGFNPERKSCYMGDEEIWVP